jgi:hypothetical protein
LHYLLTLFASQKIVLGKIFFGRSSFLRRSAKKDERPEKSPWYDMHLRFDHVIFYSLLIKEIPNTALKRFAQNRHFSQFRF